MGTATQMTKLYVKPYISIVFSSVMKLELLNLSLFFGNTALLQKKTAFRFFERFIQNFALPRKSIVDSFIIAVVDPDELDFVITDLQKTHSAQHTVEQNAFHGVGLVEDVHNGIIKLRGGMK